MNVKILASSLISACTLAMFCIGAAQAANSMAPQTGATMSTDKGTPSHPKKTNKHHAASHKAMHQQLPTSSANGNEGYRAALKTCVEGPANQRDACIDSAIMRFGRSS